MSDYLVEQARIWAEVEEKDPPNRQTAAGLLRSLATALEEAQREKEGLARENAWLRETLSRYDKALRAGEGD